MGNSEKIWFKKLEDIMKKYDSNNPTTASLLYMLNRMVDEYGEYKKIGTVEEFRRLKEEANNENSG